MWLALLVACEAEPIDGVECAEDADCLDLYGAEAPFCFPADPAFCAECSDNDHCASTERCYDGVCDLANCNTADCD